MLNVISEQNTPLLPRVSQFICGLPYKRSPANLTHKCNANVQLHNATAYLTLAVQ